MLDRYADITRDGLRENLARFLREVVPVAEEVGVRLAIHPDDPPRPLFGLPRIVSNIDDLDFITRAAHSPFNGITLCTGSLGAGAANDLPAMTARFAGRIHFVHLRNVSKQPDGSFVEADHLDGDVDMIAVVDVLLREQARRRNAGGSDWRLPFRPDHGHELLDDANRNTHPGYPLIGRMRGLAELRGVMMALAAVHRLPL
jgi:mannonate dehydratase